jgi:hypothetical protein
LVIGVALGIEAVPGIAAAWVTEAGSVIAVASVTVAAPEIAAA